MLLQVNVLFHALPSLPLGENLKLANTCRLCASWLGGLESVRVTYDAIASSFIYWSQENNFMICVRIQLVLTSPLFIETLVSRTLPFRANSVHMSEPKSSEFLPPPANATQLPKGIRATYKQVAT